MAATSPQEVTQQYLAKHNLQAALQEAVNKTLVVQPADPLGLIANELKEASLHKNPVKATVVFVLGGPGSGKGTQCKKIVKHFDFVHLSAGDLLRAEQSSGSKDAELINGYIQKGTIVPVEITVGLIKRAIDEGLAVGRTHFLVDGFPRNQDNLAGWERVVGTSCNLPLVLYTDVSEAVMEQRCLNRNQGRIDDNAETIKRRFKTFQDETMPVIKHFEAQGLLRTVDATLDPQRVFVQVCEIFAPFHWQTTFAFIKPDAVANGSTDKVLNHIREAGFQIVAKRVLQLTDAKAQEFYAEHIGKPFFPAMKEFMTSGPCVALALRARNAQKLWRATLGPTNTDTARQQAPGSIRALYGTNGTKNAAHGSDSLTSANRELNLLFPYNNFNNILGPRIIIAGAPASGKGTQAELLVASFGVVHISTGDLLREAVKAGTALGLAAKEKMESGQLVPDELVISLTKQKLESFSATVLGFLLDGFPRTGAQAQAMQDAGVQVDFFILLDVPDDELVVRVVGRRLDPVTGKIYHTKFNPAPKDIEARLVQRADDNEETVRKRIADFKRNVDAVSGFFKDKISVIPGLGVPSAIYQQVSEVLVKE